MKDKGVLTPKNGIKLVIIILMLNIALGATMYFEITDNEEMIPVRGLSMTHNGPRFGVIDQADMVLVTPYSSNESIDTYFKCLKTGKTSCGYPGDVIVFKADGGESVRIVHRVLFYLVFNLSRADIEDYDSILMDIPERRIYGARSISITSISASYNLTARKLLGPFLINSRLTTESLDELKKGGGYITLGDHNSRVDQEHIRPVKFEWIIGKAEVVDNPFGAHTTVHVYLLTFFIIMFISLNLWTYFKIYERGQYIDRRIFDLFYISFIGMYSSGFFAQAYTSRNRGSGFLLPIMLEAMVGIIIGILWIVLRPLGRSLVEVHRKKENSLIGSLMSARHAGIFQSAAGVIIAYGFMKTGYYTLYQVLIFILFMNIFYRLSIPIYFKGVPVPQDRVERNGRSLFHGLFSGDRGKEKNKITLGESRLLDWMILSLLMILLLLIHLIEGMGFEYMLIMGIVFGNLMVVNHSVDVSQDQGSTVRNRSL